MARQAELHCYHCGYAAHIVEVREEVWQIIQSAEGPGVRLGPNRTPRCGRCGGPVYLDEVTTVPDGAGEPVDLSPHRGRPLGTRGTRPRDANAA